MVEGDCRGETFLRGCMRFSTKSNLSNVVVNWKNIDFRCEWSKIAPTYREFFFLLLFIFSSAFVYSTICARRDVGAFIYACHLYTYRQGPPYATHLRNLPCTTYLWVFFFFLTRPCITKTILILVQRTANTWRGGFLLPERKVPGIDARVRFEN